MTPVTQSPTCKNRRKDGTTTVAIGRGIRTVETDRQNATAANTHGNLDGTRPRLNSKGERATDRTSPWTMDCYGRNQDNKKFTTQMLEVLGARQMNCE
jgi:hypothetical protein